MNYYGVRYSWKKRSNGTTGSRGFEVKASSPPEAERLAHIEAANQSPGCEITEIRVTQRQ
jgi:hypothetical protein